MTTFIRLIDHPDKKLALEKVVQHFKAETNHEDVFTVRSDDFHSIPGAPFAYWSGLKLRQLYRDLPPLEGNAYTVKHGSSTSDDFRFLRLYWEVARNNQSWLTIAKGGVFSQFYSDFYLVIYWRNEGEELKAFPASIIRNPSQHRRFGLTWPRRTTSGLSVRALPADCICADKGPSIFSSQDDTNALMTLNAVASSNCFQRLLELQLAAADAAARSYEIGVLQRTPLPMRDDVSDRLLGELATAAWKRKRDLDKIDEVSHAFCLPKVLIKRFIGSSLDYVDRDLKNIQRDIERAVVELYGLEETEVDISENSYCDESSSQSGASEPSMAALHRWAVGVAVGRFDWRLATGEREIPEDPAPFEPLPTKSPGMLPEEAEPFHRHQGVLVDDPGHEHDLSQIIDAVLERVEVPAPDNLRRWLQKEFFEEHLKQYSKSRRKAPIYWPLSTLSGDYTLWIYYPDLDDQTLYTAVNDFLEPKLKSVNDVLKTLRAKPDRTTAAEREIEKQECLQQELFELRDTILEIAPTYKPNHDDGVQITAAPLWQLFRHKPWQKVLKDTWESLEAGDYDWAHLAYSYWPDRVREKCKTDKSLAIAHGLEELYEEPAA